MWHAPGDLPDFQATDRTGRSADAIRIVTAKGPNSYSRMSTTDKNAIGTNRKTLFRKIRQYDLRRWIDPTETDE
jgi:hypothetical protein